MTQPAIVIAFTSRCGATETLAHATAVGIVNARTLPRLRRLADDGDAAAPPECEATVLRMRKEYVPPTEADVSGASALIVVPSVGMTPASAPWLPFMAMLERLAPLGGLAGKLAAVVHPGDRHAVAAFSAALTARGFSLVSGDALDARSHGRVVGAALVNAAREHPGT